MQEDYLELVQELLNCPQGQESELLATKPELVNEQLVETLLLVAEVREQEEGDNVGWLRGFARDLARQLGLELLGVEDEEQADGENCSQADLDFLNALIAAEQDDSRQVQQLFAQNIQRLTPQLGVTMTWYMAQVLEQQPENAEGYARLIENIVIRLSDFPLGKRAQNLEIEIAGYAAVLTARTRENNPEKWAQTQNNLASAYRTRIRGDRAENLERSIECYESALEIRTKSDLPLEWAMTQNNLANVYSDRIRGDRAENLERSIECYESALEIRSKADLPLDWAMTQNNLAIAYSDRIRGDRAENLERSIECYESALEIRSKADLPLDWAMTQNNLAIAYSKRIRGDRAENLERSIDYYRAALEIYTPEAFPHEWARIQIGLAQFSIENLRNYQVATEHLQFAYEQLSINNNDTGLLAQTMFELARCFHQTGCLEQAKIYFKDSIRLYQRLEQPTQIAAATSALGNLELQMGRIDDARLHLQTALEFYQAAGNLDRVSSIQELQQYLPVTSGADSL